ncbi:alanine/glycine:cation symporter family protein [uncultured Parasutterella sp.]|uniref:alanine/glycine:cation symporter family protein n=1 Tax=uncultured Parasutterella sp. TaxID=1263098 RepID=UPI00259A0C51|nr:alanine/glycine:cation symporter family protein [uncultured Parasutterella sp.]
MESIVSAVNDVVWSPALVYLCLGAGLFLSLRGGFLQLRHLRHMWQLLFQPKDNVTGVSSFQALSMTLAGRVGTGNIAGVATAITFGGPGAVFWMWMVAFLGASSAFVESTLGQIYKEKINGEYRGGPAFYIEKGLGIKWFAWLFAIVTIFSCGLFLPGVQANAIATSMENAFGITPAISAGAIAALLSFIVFGGLKRIAAFTTLVVPFMAQAYVIFSLVIVFMHIDMLDDVVSLIVRCAFGADAAFGAIVGMAVSWGVKRGIYSNEAGQGTGPHASSAASVSHPVKQGLVQAFSVYVDTLLVCSATAFMILITGSYNVVGPDNANLFIGLKDVATGPAYTQAAVEGLMPGFGQAFIAIALFFFAFTTVLSYYYIAETNVCYINRKLKSPFLFVILKVFVMSSCIFGAVKTADLAWAVGDIGVGLMAWLNIIAIILMHKKAFLCLKDYEKQLAIGLDPVFHPEKLRIRDADYWTGGRAEEIRDKERAKLSSGSRTDLEGGNILNV